MHNLTDGKNNLNPLCYNYFSVPDFLALNIFFVQGKREVSYNHNYPLSKSPFTIGARAELSDKINSRYRKIQTWIVNVAEIIAYEKVFVRNSHDVKRPLCDASALYLI